MKFTVDPFDPDTFKVNRAILALGMKGVGKSTLMRYLLWRIKDHVDFALAMTPSIDTQNDFKKTFVNSLVRSEYNEEVINALIEHQQRLMRDGKQTQRVLVVLDDMTYDKAVFKLKSIRNLFMNGRHLNITFFFSCQYLMDVGPDIRSNTDYVFAFRDNIADNQKKLHKAYFGGFEKFSDFRKTFLACTADYECLVLDTTSKSTNLKDTVFYFKASLDIPAYRLGNKVFHDLHKYARKPRYRNEGPPPQQPVSNITEVSKGRKRKQKTRHPIEPFTVDMK